MHKEDNHYVPEEILRSYYHQDNLEYMQNDFAREFGIDPAHVTVINNSETEAEFYRKVDAFIDKLGLRGK